MNVENDALATDQPPPPPAMDVTRSVTPYTQACPMSAPIDAPDITSTPHRVASTHTHGLAPQFQQSIPKNTRTKMTVGHMPRLAQEQIVSMTTSSESTNSPSIVALDAPTTPTATAPS
ncbi:hypothetical protein V6N12_050775 [Hibiscus sabdariffa]|uniref:Uncharacterized protein n=1 Tax=Hibiscus sabdariffa TaxID=183260 RepID=A0ABR2GE10_9ROSI